MRLGRATQPITDFLPGASYVLRCSWPGWFQRDVSVVWDYIRRASEDPVCITLLAQPGLDPESTLHLERIGDAIGDDSVLVLRTSGTTGAPKEVRKVLAEALTKKVPIRKYKGGCLPTRRFGGQGSP